MAALGLGPHRSGDIAAVLGIRVTQGAGTVGLNQDISASSSSCPSAAISRISPISCFNASWA
jgi:hypothetical protein